MNATNKTDRSFDLVDEKLFEADFFLEKLANSGVNFFEARFYFSAFVSSARSATFSLQAVMADIDGFKDWYAAKQEFLKNDETAHFFHKIRTESQHIGLTPLNSGSLRHDNNGKPMISYFFSNNGERILGAPQGDAVTASLQYLTMLVEIIFECYKKFGPLIDPDQYYTLQNLRRLGLTVEDVEESLGFPRGWTAVDESNEEERIKALRLSIPGSSIDRLFEKYLRKTKTGEAHES